MTYVKAPVSPLETGAFFLVTWNMCAPKLLLLLLHFLAVDAHGLAATAHGMLQLHSGLPLQAQIHSGKSRAQLVAQPLQIKAEFWKSLRVCVVAVGQSLQLIHLAVDLPVEFLQFGQGIAHNGIGLDPLFIRQLIKTVVERVPAVVAALLLRFVPDSLGTLAFAVLRKAVSHGSEGRRLFSTLSFLGIDHADKGQCQDKDENR